MDIKRYLLTRNEIDNAMTAMFNASDIWTTMDVRKAIVSIKLK
jgi:hypothetical protein